jgi:hypothetical protein
VPETAPPFSFAAAYVSRTTPGPAASQLPTGAPPHRVVGRGTDQPRSKPINPFLTFRPYPLPLIHAILGIRPPAERSRAGHGLPRIAWTREAAWTFGVKISLTPLALPAAAKRRVTTSWRPGRQCHARRDQRDGDPPPCSTAASREAGFGWCKGAAGRIGPGSRCFTPAPRPPASPAWRACPASRAARTGRTP